MKQYKWISELAPAEYRAFLEDELQEFREREERKEANQRELREQEMEAEERGGRHWPL